MLLPLKRPCLTCERPLRHENDEHYADGVRLRCHHCRNNWGVRSGSVFEHFFITLHELGRLLCYFDAHLTVTQATHLSAVSEDTVTKLWKLLRERARDFIQHHPIRFPGDEIVEIDELYVGALRIKGDEETRQMWPPIIGMIGRHTGWVVLDTPRSHGTSDIAPAILDALPIPSTRVFTDEHKSFQFLKDRYKHSTVHKVHRGAASWPQPKIIVTAEREALNVHTNTIEGYWSLLRTHLHASHGWTAGYLPLFLYECMFRSLKLPLTTLLQTP